MSKHHSRKTSIVSLITFIAFLGLAPASLAQPGLRKGAPDQKVILRPQIKAVKTPQSTPGGMAPAAAKLHHRGALFPRPREEKQNTHHTRQSRLAAAGDPGNDHSDLRDHNCPDGPDVPVARSSIRLRLLLLPHGRSRGWRHLRAILRRDWRNEYHGGGQYAAYQEHQSRRSSAGGPRDTHGIFPGHPPFYPTTVGGSPFSLTPSSHTQKKISFKVPPELAAGGYKISVGAEGSPGLTNPPVRFRVVLNPVLKYVLELDRIKCLKESADGPGSDEIYATAISFEVHTSSDGSFYLAVPAEAATQIYNEVDAGEYRQGIVEIRKFNQASGPVDYLMLVGLHESDKADLPGGPEEGWPKYLLYGDGEAVMEGIGPGGSMFKTNPSSREQLVSRAKLVMLSEIMKGTSGDELLGLEELRITQTDMQKAKQLNGAPIMKQLTFKGDDSLYVVDFRFRMEKSSSTHSSGSSSTLKHARRTHRRISHE